MAVFLGEHVWAWGLLLIALTIFVHSLGVVAIALPGLKLRNWLERRRLRPLSAFPVVVGFIAAVGMILAALHGIEAAIWAAAYLWSGALNSFSDALFWSVDSMTTRGESGMTLAKHLQMLGALEAIDGMLLFGISTAFIFAAMQAFWPLLLGRSDGGLRASGVGSGPENAARPIEKAIMT